MSGTSDLNNQLFPINNPSIALGGPALILGFFLLFASLLHLSALEPIPNKLVVLTFDDSVASHHSVVRPILKRHGFGATFFITEGFSFRSNKVDYMTWEQIAELHRDGFEIGNHTRDHMGVSRDTLGVLGEQVEWINQRCQEYSIPRPVSFAYPGNAITPVGVARLKELGFKFARRGGAPEHPYDWGRGFAFEPGRDHPLLVPSAGDARPDWTLADFKRAVDQATQGRIAVLQFHGVPDRDHPWVHTEPAMFESYMRYLKDNSFTVVAMRDLARFVDPDRVPENPEAIMEERKRNRTEVMVSGRIVDAATGQGIPARLYVRDASGGWHFPKSSSASAAVRYERKSSFSAEAVEMHTTLAAQPFRMELTPGLYTFTVERGKEWFPESVSIEVTPSMGPIEIRLRRWAHVAAQGWYSGDAHNHRNTSELANVMLAEDVNVALPMVDWTTTDTVPPTQSGRGMAGTFTREPVRVDDTHAWFARNTEYEIFTAGGRPHTLGALVLLHHHNRLDRPTFPIEAVAKQVHDEGGLIDLEKHNWPWSIAVVPLAKVDLFELANNHHWRVEFGVRNFAEPAPAWMKLPGSGNGIDTERAWTLYGFETYYALLNAGFRLQPSAGTANGVHPVPLGFSRVYVHLDGPFSLQSWMDGLRAGRSFVTTGPLILAKVNGQWPGHSFQVPAGSTSESTVEGEILSEHPLEAIEVLFNGQVVAQVSPENQKTAEGAHRSVVRIRSPIPITRTSWIAVRTFEQRSSGRFRFAHTAPWHFQVGNETIQPRREQIDWLIQRVQSELTRSRAILPPAGVVEYEKALGIYQAIGARVTR